MPHTSPGQHGKAVPGGVGTKRLPRGVLPLANCDVPLYCLHPPPEQLWRTGPKGKSKGRAVPFLVSEWESSLWCCRYRRASWLANSAITQAHIQVFDLAHPNIYPNYELTEHIKAQNSPSRSTGQRATAGYLRGVLVSIA